jgi:hypothetical protein
LDDGVSSGKYGYGSLVDTAFKYLASEGSFLLGTVRARVWPENDTLFACVRASTLACAWCLTQLWRGLPAGLLARAQFLILAAVLAVLRLGPPPSMLD